MLLCASIPSIQMVQVMSHSWNPGIATHRGNRQNSLGYRGFSINSFQCSNPQHPQYPPKQFSETGNWHKHEQFHVHSQLPKTRFIDQRIVPKASNMIITQLKTREELPSNAEYFYNKVIASQQKGIQEKSESQSIYITIMEQTQVQIH